MKKIYLLTILLLFAFGTKADIVVKSFKKLENDMSARIDAPKKDQNGDVCAIIKVVTTQTGFSWEPDALGIVWAENKAGEYWLYVPYGAKRITIKHPLLGVLRDYMFPESIEKATVYELVLATGKVTTTVEEEITNQWLIINPDPADAMIYLNDQYVKSGVYQAKVKPGSYTYRVEAPLRHSEAGKFDILDAKKELNIALKPAYGYISINSSPETAARVSIDGKLLDQTTPCCTEAVASGEHTIVVIKEMFLPFTQKVVVSDGKTTPVFAEMKPNFSTLSIITDADADLFVDNQPKGTGQWSGRIGSGIHTLEARKTNFRAARQDVDLTVGENKVVTLVPSPIYGSLDVMTDPPKAIISLDGKEIGETPNTISKLFIGSYRMQISKPGYKTILKKIDIEENKITEINESLKIDSNKFEVVSGPNAVVQKATNQAKVVTILSNPAGATLYIDDHQAGTTPYNCSLPYGVHLLRIEINGKRTTKSITVTQNPNDNIFILRINGKSEMIEKNPIVYAGFGLKGGFNSATLNTMLAPFDESSEFAFFPTFGAVLSFTSGIYSTDKTKVNNKTGIQFELNISQQGTPYQDGNITLDYLTLPVLFKKYLSNHLTFGFGGYASYLFRSETGTVVWNSWNQSTSTMDDVEVVWPELVGSMDYGVIVALGLESRSGPFLDARYQFGLKNLAGNLEARNELITISAGWKF